MAICCISLAYVAHSPRTYEVITEASPPVQPQGRQYIEARGESGDEDRYADGEDPQEETGQLIAEGGGDVHPPSQGEENEEEESEEVSAAYKTGWKVQPLQHGRDAHGSASASDDTGTLFGTGGTSTFKQRYLYTLRKGPTKAKPKGKRGTGYTPGILFYCGNELSIVDIWHSAGFIHALGKTLGATVLFAEHRYYGRSMPPSMPLTPDTYDHLSVEAALKDFATLIAAFKKKHGLAPDTPVVAVGGSYGGMLAAYLRMKYPRVVAGAIAASAPVRGFPGMGTSPGAFTEVVTKSFRAGSKEGTARGATCDQRVHAAFKVLQRLQTTAKGRTALAKGMNACKELDDEADAETLNSWAKAGLEFMAMVDYPYKANFLKALPANPVRAACANFEARYGKAKRAGGKVEDMALLQGLSAAVNTYYNSEHLGRCLDVTESQSKSLGDNQWAYQACTQMMTPMSNCGKYPKTMFLPINPWSESQYASQCAGQFPSATLHKHHMSHHYGDKQIAASSNIIFTNGDKDPWHPYGVLTGVSRSVEAVLMKGAAHHLDLRTPHASDPHDVKKTRLKHRALVKAWFSKAVSHGSSSDKAHIERN